MSIIILWILKLSKYRAILDYSKYQDSNYEKRVPISYLPISAIFPDHLPQY